MGKGKATPGQAIWEIAVMLYKGSKLKMFLSNCTFSAAA